MSKEFNCPSCSVSITFEGGESIFQTCGACHAPVIVPSDFLYEKGERLASENFASLTNDKPVDVEQVTNELTPGRNLPKGDDVIDPEARIEKFEVYQEKIGTGAVEAKAVVDKIVTPVAEETGSTVGFIAAKIQSELKAGNKIEAIGIFREHYQTSLKTAKEVVEAMQQGKAIDFSAFRERKD